LKKILIISPDYPPCNLAGVHRARLFAQHLPEFGWEPIVLCVDEKYYEFELDWNLQKLLPENQRIEKVKAFRVTRPRLIGDIGLRSLYFLRNKALQLIKNEKIDFVYIPIPSFYVSLLGPYLNRMTGVKYGIDYIDPWVHVFPGSEKTFSRHWWSTRLAKWLEPKAVTKASLITGVAPGYYQGVIERNPKLRTTCLFGAMPYGGEKADHIRLNELGIEPYLFKNNNKIQLVYAGAMLPKAFAPLRSLFQSLVSNIEIFKNIEFHFIGTGKIPNDPNSYTIKPIAEEYGIWQTNIFEYPKRIPYLDVLVHLNAASGVFILGSTEPHYTPSKVYQAVLSQKPVLAVLHEKSSAASVLRDSKAGKVFTFAGEADLVKINKDFKGVFAEFIAFMERFDPAAVNENVFEEYSAKAVTGKLVDLLNQVL
jgi:hypothetical protein